MADREHKLGVFYAGGSYLIWGILPIYWKFLDHVNPVEILATRIFWAFMFMIIVLFFSKKLLLFSDVVRGMLKNKRQTSALIIASLLISVNWFIYIWAVNHDRIIEASLGYYINPLISVLLGMIVLKEKLSNAQYFAFGIAAIGVVVLTVSYGVFPWISFGLAISFGVYGLVKKLLRVDSEIGLTLETLVVTPIALIYLLYLFFQNQHSYFAVSFSTDLLLIGSGAATAVPLLYFAKGAQKIPLSMLGFLQYIAPTISLLIGIQVYHEKFTGIHLLSFSFIWVALLLFTISQTKIFTLIEMKRKNVG
jgi:chloramphenicol-sensitive protein RarD